MTREEAISILEMLRFPEPWEQKLSKGAEEALDRAISALSENKGEWIPVSERNPDIYKKVEKYLITDDEGQVRTACFVSCGEACWWDYLHVVAWMPLPEPYKEGGE